MRDQPMRASRPGSAAMLLPAAVTVSGGFALDLQVSVGFCRY